MVTAQSKGTSFVVHLDGVDIPEKDRAQLARVIQGAALSELARIDLGGGVNIHIPLREWLGLWLQRVPPREVPIPMIKVELRG